jgi:hypothetical protein
MATSINGQIFKLLLKEGTTTKIATVVKYFPDDPSTATFDSRATLDPNSSLDSGIIYKAVVTTGAKDVAATPSTRTAQQPAYSKRRGPSQ